MENQIVLLEYFFNREIDSWLVKKVVRFLFLYGWRLIWFCFCVEPNYVIVLRSYGWEGHNQVLI